MSKQTVEIDPISQANIDAWLSGDYDLETKKEIQDLLENNPQAAIDAFYKELEFGTGGLRGIMGVGTNRMNIYTVHAATQGLANYLKKKCDHSPSVFISYDSRHHSSLFAEEAAKVLVGNDIQVYLTKELRPTPLVSFGCRLKKCDAAIMITASHNPPEYNGYKAYWSDGAQVLPPHDKGIIEEVQKIHDLSQIKIGKSTLIQYVGEEVDAAYYEAISPLALYPKQNQEHGNALKVVYTPLYGTGITLLPEAFKNWGFSNVSYVEEQTSPNGSFPTSPSPNPETAEALQLGTDQLKACEGDLLIATDPDADRIGIAILHHKNVHLLTGNQVACLLMDHICEALTSQNCMPENAVFIKTLGTTEMMVAIAEHYQRPCLSVHTGFKYIAEKIREWENSEDGYQFIFGGEESYGYLMGTQTRDKDGILCANLICEVALKAKMEGKTLLDKMNELYKKYGYFFEEVTSIKFGESKADQEKMTRQMRALRTSPLRKIADIPVIIQEDYLTGVKTFLQENQKEQLDLAKSNVLLFWLKDGTKIVVRPSGTEPKIKVYCGVRSNPSEGGEKAQKILKIFVDSNFL